MEDNIKPYSAEELNTRLDRVNSWIDNCDQKASILLAFAGALAAVLLTSELWESIRHHREIYTSVNGMDYTPDVRERLDGFPAPGTEAERFYKPGGAYHKACGEGRLYLMAPLAENYDDSRVIERTEAELKRKAEEKGKRYYGIPHESTRWRMIAGNVMMRMLSERN